jgi:hypothetical protein
MVYRVNIRVSVGGWKMGYWSCVVLVRLKLIWRDAGSRIVERYMYCECVVALRD